MSVSIQIKQRDIDKLDRAITRIALLSKKQKDAVTMDAAVVFVNNAQKHTPPVAGKKNIPVKKFKRDIEAYKDNKNTWSPPGYDYKLKYRVAYFPDGRKGRRPKNVWYTRTKGQARDYAKIKYRGLGRAGWFMNMVRLGHKITTGMTKKGQVKLNYKAGKEARIKGYRQSSTRVHRTGSRATVTVTNATPNIGGYARISEVKGFGAAVNFMHHRMKAMEKEYKKKWG